jgi:hypothetical protein
MALMICSPIATGLTSSARICRSSRRQVHVDQQFHVLASTTSRSSDRHAAQRLHYIFSLQIGMVGEDFVHGVTCPDLANDRPDRDTLASDAWLAAHDLGVLSNAIELDHRLISSQRGAGRNYARMI